MKQVWKGWAVLFVFTLICMAVNWIFFPIHHIICLEFAPNTEKMLEYIKKIGDTPAASYHILKMNTVVDYAFIFGYTLLTILSFRILLDVFGVGMSTSIYLLAMLPGLLDAAENIFLINSACQQRADFSCLYYYIVRIKWGLAMIPVMVIPIVGVYGLVILMRAKQVE